MSYTYVVTVVCTCEIFATFMAQIGQFVVFRATLYVFSEDAYDDSL